MNVLEDNVTQDSVTQSDVLTNLPRVLLEDENNNSFEIGVETLLRLRVEGAADNSWGGKKYAIKLTPGHNTCTLSTYSFKAEKGWILETKIKSLQKSNISINVEVDGNFKNSIVLNFYDLSAEVQSFLGFGCNGFLLVTRDNGEKISIATYTKVSSVRFNEDKSREEFIILEWPYLNVKASVQCETVGKSRFGIIRYEPPAKIYFNKAKGELKLGNQIIPAYTDPNNPISNGTHNIWLPDMPHDYGFPYLEETKFSLIWLRLGAESSDRYLHAGLVSAGCISVGNQSEDDDTPEVDKWTIVYNYLCKRRNGNKFIGEIIVS